MKIIYIVKTHLDNMNKPKIILSKFYLKNGVIIEDTITFDKDTTEEEIQLILNRIKETIEEGCKSGEEFVVSGDTTTIRGSELAAFSLIKKLED